MSAEGFIRNYIYNDVMDIQGKGAVGFKIEMAPKGEEFKEVEYVMGLTLPCSNHIVTHGYGFGRRTRTRATNIVCDLWEHGISPEDIYLELHEFRPYP